MESSSFPKKSIKILFKSSKYLECQVKIGGNKGLHCAHCTNQDDNDYCDTDGCPTSESTYKSDRVGVVYNPITRKCDLCQENIANTKQLNCAECRENGAGKCDAVGCPAPGVIFYNATTSMCEEDFTNIQCTHWSTPPPIQFLNY